MKNRNRAAQMGAGAAVALGMMAPNASADVFNTFQSENREYAWCSGTIRLLQLTPTTVQAQADRGLNCQPNPIITGPAKAFVRVRTDTQSLGTTTQDLVDYFPGPGGDDWRLESDVRSPVVTLYSDGTIYGEVVVQNGPWQVGAGRVKLVYDHPDPPPPPPVK